MIGSKDKSAYQVDLQSQWQDYIVQFNKGFFDSNKLYLKSMVDYKTMHYKKPLDPMDLGLVETTKAPLPQAGKQIIDSGNSGEVPTSGDPKNTTIMSGQGSIPKELPKVVTSGESIINNKS